MSLIEHQTKVKSSKHEYIVPQPDASLIQLYQELADHPQGGDPDLGLYSQGMVNLMKRDPSIETYLRKIQEKRRENGRPLTDKQLVTLTQRALQYILLRQGFYAGLSPDQWDTPYSRILNLDTPEAWAQFIQNMTTEHAGLYEKTLRERDNATNVDQRGAGPHWVIREFYGDGKVIVGDMGCSTNGILAQMATNRPLLPIKYQGFPDGGQSIRNELVQPVNLVQGYGVDISNPYDHINFILSCRYPRESTRKEIEETRSRIEENRNLPNIHFVQANMLYPPFTEETEFGAIIYATTLYQLDNGTVMQAIDKGLERAPFVIVQDFFVKDPQKTLRSVPLSGNNSYGLFIITREKPRKPLELARWNGGRCQILYPGEDYEETIQIARDFRQRNIN